MRSLPILLIALVLAFPPAVAGSVNDPEITDAQGDAGPVPSPVGFAWADIVAAWFDEIPSGVQATIQVVDLTTDPPGEVGVHFQHKGTWWLAGWTTILFPAPPFSYAGGFYCVADADGNVPDASLCNGLNATLVENRIEVELPRGIFGWTPGAVLSSPRGYAVDLISAQPEAQFGPIETTDLGRDFVLATLATIPEERPLAPEEPDDATTDAPSVPEAGRDAPGLSGVLLGLVALAFAGRRRA